MNNLGFQSLRQSTKNKNFIFLSDRKMTRRVMFHIVVLMQHFGCDKIRPKHMFCVDMFLEGIVKSIPNSIYLIVQLSQTFLESYLRLYVCN